MPCSLVVATGGDTDANTDDTGDEGRRAGEDECDCGVETERADNSGEELLHVRSDSSEVAHE